VKHDGGNGFLEFGGKCNRSRCVYANLCAMMFAEMIYISYENPISYSLLVCFFSFEEEFLCHTVTTPIVCQSPMGENNERMNSSCKGMIC
jgi:hypothetical protein